MNYVGNASKGSGGKKRKNIPAFITVRGGMKKKSSPPRSAWKGQKRIDIRVFLLPNLVEGKGKVPR